MTDATRQRTVLACQERRQKLPAASLREAIRLALAWTPKRFSPAVCALANPRASG